MITCTFENNGKASLRHVTIGAIIVRDNKILLVKRAAHLINPNKYSLPGGFLDRNEDTKTGVKREIQEETGYKCNNLRFFRINDNPNRPQEDRQNVDFIFLAEVLEKVSKADKEVKESEWFPLDDLPDAKDFAFDHYDDVKLYIKYKKSPFNLPQIG